MNTILFFLIKFDIYSHYISITTFIGLGHELQLQLQNKPRIKKSFFCHLFALPLGCSDFLPCNSVDTHSITN